MYKLTKIGPLGDELPDDAEGHQVVRVERDLLAQPLFVTAAISASSMTWEADYSPQACERIRSVWASYAGHFQRASSFRLREQLFARFPWMASVLAEGRR